MFLALLRTQWRWCRSVVVPATLLALILPFLVLRGVEPRMVAAEVMHLVTAWGPVFPALAALLGLLTALATWAPDRRGQHVHALSLPLARWRYVLHRLLGGLLILALPVAACAFGAWGATQGTALPAGLTPYPWSLAFRFAVAVALAYTLFFAILSGTPRTAAMILGAVVLVLAVDLVLGMTAPGFELGEDLLFALVNGPGPLALFAWGWSLVDV
jgi:hypothetical protein